MATSSKSCDICATETLKHPNVIVKCESCEGSMCRECWVRMLMANSMAPRCPFECRKIMSLRFVSLNLGTRGMVEYRKVQTDELISADRALLPEYQELAAALKQIDAACKERTVEVHDAQVADLHAQLQEATARYVALKQELVKANEAKQLADKAANPSRLYTTLASSTKHAEFNKILLRTHDRVEALQGRVQAAGQPEAAAAEAGASTGGPGVSSRHEGCPVVGCRGYVNHKEKVCGLCAAEVCLKCMSALPEGADARTAHECCADKLASLELIRQECKQCPWCSVRTQRSYGCSQMWCTHCEKPWDYSTGQRLTGNVYIHNPHYAAKQRQRQLQQEDEYACMPDFQVLNSAQAICRSELMVERVRRISQLADDLRVRTVRSSGLLALNNMGTVSQRHRTRTLYIAGLIEESEYKRLVYVQEMADQATAERERLLRNTLDSMIHVIRRLLSSLGRNTNLVRGMTLEQRDAREYEALQELEVLREEGNAALLDIYAEYKNSQEYHISPKYHFEPNGRRISGKRPRGHPVKEAEKAAMDELVDYAMTAARQQGEAAAAPTREDMEDAAIVLD